MTHSTDATAAHTAPRGANPTRLWRLKLIFLARPRLISNLLALVALFSIGFV
jgi:hypothetical protein